MHDDVRTWTNPNRARSLRCVTIVAVQTRFLSQLHDFVSTQRPRPRTDVLSDSSSSELVDDASDDSNIGGDNGASRAAPNHLHRASAPSSEDLAILNSLEALRIDDIED